MSNGEPMKQSDLDEVFKVVSLHNGTDIDYEGKSFKNISVVGPLICKKAGRFEKLLGLARSHSIVTCHMWRSESLVRHHTTPFLLF